MKLVTKMRKFVERMENVESMTERQLTEMLFRAEKIMGEYIAIEERKDAAYERLKESAKRWTGKSKKQQQQKEQEEEEAVEVVEEIVEEEITEDVMEEVAMTLINEEVETMNISQQILNQGRLVITKHSEEKGMMVGAYHKDGAITYFSSSDSFDNPVVFGNPALTTEIKDSIVKQVPNFYQPVTKNFKSIAMFGKSNGQNAMIYLANAKRLVFEGYIGNMVFSTTKDYIEKGYNPLVTRADIFIENGGKHNHVTDNMCTPSLKKLIAALIEQYMTSPKFAKASNDVEYFNRLRAAKRQQVQQERVVIEPKPQPVVQNYGYGIDDIYAAMQQAPVVVNGGGVEYDPEF